MRKAKTLVLFITLCILSGCGQTGALYLPTHPSAQAVAGKSHIES